MTKWSGKIQDLKERQSKSILVRIRSSVTGDKTEFHRILIRCSIIYFFILIRIIPVSPDINWPVPGSGKSSVGLRGCKATLHTPQFHCVWCCDSEKIRQISKTARHQHTSPAMDGSWTPHSSQKAKVISKELQITKSTVEIFKECASVVTLGHRSEHYKNS